MALRNLFTLTLFLFVLPNVEPTKWYHTYAGPFKIVIKKVETCPTGKGEGPRLSTVQFRVHKAPHQPERYSLNISAPNDLDDSVGGIYRGYNITLPEELLFSPYVREFMYGRWRADVELTVNTGEVGACGRLFIETLPK